MTNKIVKNNNSGGALGKNTFSFWKILLPVAIGLTVVVLMFIHDARKEDLLSVWEGIHFNNRTVWFILIAFICMFGRDFGLTWRFRALTDYQLSWGKAYKVDMLCEFTSCVTPSAVGGSSLGMIFLNTQGIEFGRATTLMITTLFLDELFFTLACPIVVLFTPAHELFASAGTSFSHGIKYTFWFVYIILVLWTFILFTGIIWKPGWINSLLGRMSKWKILSRWSDKMTDLGNNMVATSVELKKKPFGFWCEVFGGTALSWISRYLVVNALFFGLMPSDDPYQWIIFARQIVIWVVMMVCPTPGGAGLSEWLFSEYYGDLVATAGIALIMAIFWRLITYYLYLCIGAIIVPGWLSSSLNKVRQNGGVEKTEGKDIPVAETSGKIKIDSTETKQHNIKR